MVKLCVGRGAGFAFAHAVEALEGFATETQAVVQQQGGSVRRPRPWWCMHVVMCLCLSLCVRVCVVCLMWCGCCGVCLQYGLRGFSCVSCDACHDVWIFLCLGVWKCGDGHHDVCVHLYLCA